MHIFTTRHGGNSSEPYDTNNLGFHVDDDTESVLQNHHDLAANQDYEWKRLIHMRQIHSDRVIQVDEGHDFTSPPECDAIITNRPDIPLMVMVADCTPILLYDTKQHACAAIHAGRAGAFKNIIGKTIDAMGEAFQTDPKDLIAALGPSICHECYEVNETIYTEACSVNAEHAMACRNGKWYLDVRAILHRQLQEAGLKEEAIEHIDRCSACENQEFFSYRADGGRTGRMAGVIMLKP